MTPEQIETLKHHLAEMEQHRKDWLQQTLSTSDKGAEETANGYTPIIAALRAAIETMERAEKLPKTADGVTAWPGDKVWVQSSAVPGKAFRLDIIECKDGEEFYSTKEAALAAANKAIGGGA